MKKLFLFALVLASAPLNSASAAAAAQEQQILMQSLADEVESAMRRGDTARAKALASQAYTEFTRYKNVSDEEKAAMLSRIEHALVPPKMEKKREAALLEKERSILQTWLSNIKQVIDEKQARDYYQRAQADVNKFRHLPQSERDALLKQMKDYADFLAPVAQGKPGQAEQKQAAAKTVQLQDVQAMRIAAENRAKLSPAQQEELDMKLWRVFHNIGDRVLQLVEELLQQGANPNQGKGYNEIPPQIWEWVYSAAKSPISKRKELVEPMLVLLIRYGFNINADIGANETLLLGMARNARVFYPLQIRLLELGANATATDNQKNSVLHILASRIQQTTQLLTQDEYKKIIDALTRHGADINARNQLGFTPLAAAAIAGNYNFMRAILPFNPNPFIGIENADDPLSKLDHWLKILAQRNLESSTKGMFTKSIEELKQARQELLDYRKIFKEKYGKEIQQATGMPTPALPGIMAEYLFGQEPRPEAEKE